MWIPKRAVLATSLVAIAALSLALAVGAFGDRGRDHGGNHRGNALLESSLAPSLTSDPVFHGVAPGGAPWVLRRGDVELKRSRLELRVRGLVIPSPPGDGTAGPVKTISASLYCGADSETKLADTTATTPISPSGTRASGTARSPRRTAAWRR